MKNLMILFIGVVVFSGCLKDVAGDIIITGIGHALSSDSDKNKKSNCKEYKAKFNWSTKINNGHEITDMVSDNEVLYILKKSFYKYEVLEQNPQTGELINSVQFDFIECAKANTIDNSSMDDMIFFKERKLKGRFIAYNKNLHKVIWVRKCSDLMEELANGYFYDLVKDGYNNKYSIDKINPTTGENEIIYTLPNSYKGIPANNINNLHAYSDEFGKLYFTYALSYKNDRGAINTVVNIFNFENKTVNEIYKFNGSVGTIILDEKNIFFNISSDLYCFNRYSGVKQWINYNISNINNYSGFLEVVDNYIINGYLNRLNIINKETGENVLIKDGFHGSISCLSYKNYIIAIDNQFVYKLNLDGEIKEKYISKYYCETNTSLYNQWAIKTAYDEIITCDKKYFGSIIFNQK